MTADVPDRSMELNMTSFSVADRMAERPRLRRYSAGMTASCFSSKYLAMRRNSLMQYGVSRVGGQEWKG